MFVSQLRNYVLEKDSFVCCKTWLDKQDKLEGHAPVRQLLLMSLTPVTSSKGRAHITADFCDLINFEGLEALLGWNDPLTPASTY